MKKWLTIFTALTLGLLTACAPSSGVPSGTAGETYDPEIELTWEDTRNSLSATDAYGRHFGAIGGYDEDKQVGLFYFLWNGSDENRSVWDSSLLSEDTLKNDTSSVGAFHYWAEPLYGYYDSGDPWVIRRHMELFAMAGVDYIVFDTSNGYIYEDVCENLFAVALELQEQGFESCVLSVYHYLLGPAGMDETMVAAMNEAMKAVVEDPTVNEGIAAIGNIPGWHDLEESKEIRETEYAQFVQIAKDLDMYVQE